MEELIIADVELRKSVLDYMKRLNIPYTYDRAVTITVGEYDYPRIEGFASGYLKRREETTMAPSNEIICSFCGNHENEAEFFLAGPNGVYICTECIEAAIEIFEEKRNG